MRTITAPGGRLPILRGRSTSSAGKVMLADGEARRASVVTATHRAAPLLALVPVATVLVAVLLWTGRAGMTEATPRQVYTVAAIQARLARGPGAWVGRTIMVQGIVVAGEPVDYPSLSLVDADASATVDPLPLARMGPDPLRAFLRRLPWLGSLAPRAQAVRWDEVAVYRIQLRVQTRAFCGASVCYEAMLLDAAP